MEGDTSGGGEYEPGDAPSPRSPRLVHLPQAEDPHPTAVNMSYEDLQFLRNLEDALLQDVPEPILHDLPGVEAETVAQVEGGLPDNHPSSCRMEQPCDDGGGVTARLQDLTANSASGVNEADPAMAPSAAELGLQLSADPVLGVTADQHSMGCTMEEIYGLDSERAGNENISLDLVTYHHPADKARFEETVKSYVGSKQWDQLEDYFRYTMRKDRTFENHPMPYMYVRRAALWDKLDNLGKDESILFYSTWIEPFFYPNIDTEYVSSTFLANEKNFMRNCVYGENSRTNHPYGDESFLTTLIVDYFKIYFPEEIGHKLPIIPRQGRNLWKLAEYIGEKKPRPDFRCLVCSIKNFTKSHIGSLKTHLTSECIGAKSKFVQDLIPELAPCTVQIQAATDHISDDILDETQRTAVDTVRAVLLQKFIVTSDLLKVQDSLGQNWCHSWRW